MISYKQEESPIGSMDMEISSGENESAHNSQNRLMQHPGGARPPMQNLPAMGMRGPHPIGQQGTNGMPPNYDPR